MASTKDLQRLVCVNCKLRKKKCDRAQPSCAYCVRKKLECQYTSDIKHFPIQPKSLVTPDPIIRSSLLLSSTLSDVLLSAPTNIESTLYFQILRIIRTTGLDVDDFSARYFRGIHMFIPILSRPRFHDQLVQSGVPSAAFSVLLLCMCMITYHPEFASQSRSLDQATLYLTAKSLLTQVQTSFPPSLHLIQASVIIAAYEYANGKIHNALVSIGSCARMGYTIGLHLASPVDIVDSDTCFEAEKCNTWWGIIICERTFFCELDNFHQPFVSKITSSKSPISPVTARQIPPLPLVHPPLPMNRISISTERPSAEECTGFACLTQAAYLLDQLFQVLEIPDLNSRLIQLDGLDHALRTFFSLSMDQAQGKWGFYCTSNVMVIRALYIIHWHILDQVPKMGSCTYKSPSEWQINSYAALDSITKMEARTAATRSNLPLELIDALPPSCLFLMREALKHIGDSGDKSKVWGIDDQELKNATKKLEDRWDVK